MSQRKNILRVRVPYVSKDKAFDVVELHYDDEHKGYHICAGKWDEALKTLFYFRLDPHTTYFGLNCARRGLAEKVQYKDEGTPQKAPIEWVSPVQGGSDHEE